MPSKYTDEIENSSYTWRGFLCLENQKLNILKETGHSSFR